ncbi:MAG: DNA-binding protein WhiA [Selenomonadaceae bacterium]|nr:DNA-binding protein WhiA [Selenomonadaceae bacterium]
MPSFATEVKNELAHQKPARKECCRRAELAALLRLGGQRPAESPEGSLSFVTENAAVARLVLTLIKSELPGVLTKIAVSRGRRLKKTNSYAIMLLPSPTLNNLLNPADKGGRHKKSLDRYLVRRTCCQVAYLKGAFLARGSVSRPTADYHLEIATENQPLAALIRDLLERLDFTPGDSERKDAYVVYLKEGEAVMDFLGMLKAEAAVEAFESAKNLKEVRGQVNRLVNCETANLQRIGEAAARQMEAIGKLDKVGLLPTLNKTLRETAAARRNNPEASLAELAAILCVSKSGLNHRLRKLMELARG